MFKGYIDKTGAFETDWGDVSPYEIMSKPQQFVEMKRFIDHYLDTLDRFNSSIWAWRHETSFFSNPAEIKDNGYFTLSVSIVSECPFLLHVIADAIMEKPSLLYLILEGVLGPIDIPDEYRGNISDICDCWFEEYADMAQPLIDRYVKIMNEG